MYNTWVPGADSGCKENPPEIPTDGTCEINACTRLALPRMAKHWQEKMSKAALCNEWLDELKSINYTTPYPPFNPTKDLKNNCPNNPDFWFIEGELLEEGAPKKT